MAKLNSELISALMSTTDPAPDPPDRAPTPCKIEDDIEPLAAARTSTPYMIEDDIVPLDAAEHYTRRFTDLFKVAADVQRIAGYLVLDRNKVLVKGPSEYQDQTSSAYKQKLIEQKGDKLTEDDLKVDAAHVIRIQLSDDVKKNLKCKELIDYLKSFMGHTQNMKQWANRGALARNIDVLQEDLLKLLEVIDFEADTPRFVNNFRTAHVKDVLDKMNGFLRKKHPDANVNLYDFIDWNGRTNLKVNNIPEFCRQTYMSLLILWMCPKPNHYMNKEEYKNVLIKTIEKIDKITVEKLLEMGRDHMKMMKSLKRCCKEEAELNRQIKIQHQNDESEAYGRQMREEARLESISGGITLSMLAVPVIVANVSAITLIGLGTGGAALFLAAAAGVKFIKKIRSKREQQPSSRESFQNCVNGDPVHNTTSLNPRAKRLYNVLYLNDDSNACCKTRHDTMKDRVEIPIMESAPNMANMSIAAIAGSVASASIMNSAPIKGM